ncbi:MAG: hypothetical protein LBK05_06825, partial [Treponema sp.]|nr:hypothetical protein [Treponema sp.]
SRPELPLAIAGIAKARTYESGEAEKGEERGTVMEINQAFASEIDNEDEEEYSKPFVSFSRRRHMDVTEGLSDDSETNISSGYLGTARAKPAGEQFTFTLKDGVSIERRQSAMLPLIEAEMQVEKLLVLSGKDALSGTVNPSVSVELVNTTGMKLPAGPITVYDGGSYAGDALIEFLPENEKRIISYGEDLSVQGSVNYSGTNTVTAVALSKGLLNVSRTKKHESVYTVRNASSTPRKLIIEHPITSDAGLVEPAKYEEKTPGLYRFAAELPANREIEFTVIEEEPLSEDITIGHLSWETALGYSTDKRIPDDIRIVLKKASDIMKKIDDVKDSAGKLERKRDGIIEKQERIRQNLEAAGNQSAQGQQYLSRLVAMDDEIDALTKSMEEAEEKAKALRKELEEVIGASLPAPKRGHKHGRKPASTTKMREI